MPGQFEVKDSKKMWVRGHYESQDRGVSPAMAPATSGDAAVQQGGGPTHNTLKGFVCPFDRQAQQIQGQGQIQNRNLNQGQTQSQPQAATTAGQWIPGHLETLNGVSSWVRGYYVGQKNVVAGPPKELIQQIAPLQAKLQGWAVVIGISNYKHAAGHFPELRYATQDAEEFYNFLRSPEGGGLAPERILFLRNEAATLENIKYAFFDFLKQALEEDFILVYFAGHGTPEEDNPENLYLLAHDSVPDRLASTAFPMWDIDTAFKRYIKSQKVVMLTDACP